MLRIILFCFLLSFFRFVDAQIASKVIINQHRSDEAKILRINWSPEEEHHWCNVNQDRLEVMAISVGLNSSLLTNTTKGYLFEIEQPAPIEILFRVEKFDRSEHLLFKDIHTGEVIFELPHDGRGEILTPAFDPSGIAMYWISDNSHKPVSQFSIENIYVTPVQLRDSRAIGFGTALPCFPNAACKTDTLLQKISNTTVRIRMVMEEGIGWCSGSFVNNTRNDKAPLLLTAYHCQFNYTPKYELWRFDLQYKSDSCTNPVSEPQFFSLTGCQLKASGQGSDFLLVLLDQDVPVNQLVTFAGWNRDSISLPDTMFLVHHPNADIRKFSTCTDGAVIHPNPIGWSEGYTTPANHHFSLGFTEGGHQPGSSGGPVFNKHGLLIGQLHGGFMGCEADNHAFVGRFSKSWNLGSGPSQRLKDWLDPDQTEVMSWPSIENIESNDLIDISGIVTDPIGRPVRNVKIEVTGGATQDLVTDAQGHFEITGINRTLHYSIKASKDDNQTNGLNVIDLIAIQKHLLQIHTFDFPWQTIAADATNNHVVSVGDISLLLRLLLGKISFMPSSPSWRFDPPILELENLPAGPNQVTVMGIKIGDINNTADPSK